MSSIKQIEKAIGRLPIDDVKTLRDWMDEYYADLVDQKLEQAILAGKFDRLGEEALAEHRAGRSKPL